MPTVLHKEGFEIKIYTADHGPEHVHIFKAGRELILNISDQSMRRNYGMSPRDVRRAIEIVAENRDFLLAEWKRIKPIP